MLSDRDVDKLMKVFATKDEVRHIVREEMSGMQEVVKKTYEAVEHLVSDKETQKFENAARDAQLSRHDGWIKHISKETNIKLSDA